MLGKRGGAWIVVTPGYRPKVLAVHGSRVRTVWKHTYDESDTHYTLAKGGSLVAQWSFDRGATAVAVFDLTGKVVAHRNWGGTVRLLDFLGDTLLISTLTKTQTWTVPGKPVSAAPDAWFGDLDADLVVGDLRAAGPRVQGGLRRGAGLGTRRQPARPGQERADQSTGPVHDGRHL